MPALLLATKNAHKTGEIREILGKTWEVTDMNAFPTIPAPEETGATFAENASIKAVAASELFPGWVLSDDSGLEVDALSGAPGVHSARYAGEKATDAENRAKLLYEMDAVGARGRTRSGRFRCVMALARGGKLISTFDGTSEGIIAPRERGTGGFGYDALFIPRGFCKSFAQLSSEMKNGLSHRGQALEAARQYLAAAE